MAIQPKKTTACDNYKTIMQGVTSAVIEQLSTIIPTLSIDTKYGDRGGVNDTIETALKGLGFNTTSCPHSIALLDRYARSASQLLPTRDYNLETWDKEVFKTWRAGAFLKGHIPKPSTATTSKGKTSLPFDRLDIIAAMRAIVDCDEEGNAVVSEWTTLDDESFIEAYTLEILESDSLVSAAIDRLKIAQQTAIEAANAQRLAALKGKKLSFKITPKA